MNRFKYSLIAIGILLRYSPVLSQPNIPVNGPKNSSIEYNAFTHATLFIDYHTKLEDATLITQNGKVIAAGVKVKIPTEARVFNCRGKYIYPGFIDLYTDYGLVWKPEKKENGDNQLLSSKPGAYAWNEAVRSEVNASELFRYDELKAKLLREAGFATVVTGLQDGICRGTSALVFTAMGKENELMISEKIASGLSFQKGSSTQHYPSSLTGVIALLRQTYYDGRWYASQDKEKNISLAAFNALQALPQVFAVNDKLDILRANRIGEEFKVKYIIKSSGDEYQRIAEIKTTSVPLIIPLNFPKPYDVENLLEAQAYPTSDLKHWELAPSNAGRLAKAGIEFAITYNGCENASEFLQNLRKAVTAGLDTTSALKSLTETPAKLIRQEKNLGALKPGMYANFSITTGSIFNKETQLAECWSAGKRYIISTSPGITLLGEYHVSLEAYPRLLIKGSEKKLQATLLGKDTLKGNVSADAGLYTIQFGRKDVSFPTVLWIKKQTEESYPRQATNLEGKLNDSAGRSIYFTATLTREVQPDSVKKDSIVEFQVTGDVVYPFTDYGWKQQPLAEKILFKNATVWTNEKDSVLTGTDVLIEGGKIKSIGVGINAPGAKEIDATGKFLTSGIIDEHSHIAIARGVNEGTQAVTSEVRMGDVIYSEDINIYRQLSGGVTASQLLHGSANPIGGQSALIKLRWGLAPEKMKIENADGFIKFALGENVKQSNWGDRAVFRYPQTRMGVEQVYQDAFTRARKYDQKKEGYVDLELEALSEILHNKRFITCHSYVQSEINMLIHIADSFGFRINTFTHILEGYKVADKMKKHGVGASTFADWWAYKYEVMEAIPYNAAILTKMGVVTAINSDDAEMGRRLNQEAAKTIKYGGMSEMEAWKMVTLNPAKLLHLDQRMGSIKVGKDADVVLWSNNPLSIYAKVLYTFIDGTCYFDRQKDELMRGEIMKERQRLMRKMIAARANGEKTDKKTIVPRDEYHCDTEIDYGK